MAKKPNEEQKIIGAGIGGAAGGILGAIVGGPIGAAIGAGVSGWLGHLIETEIRKNQK